MKAVQIQKYGPAESLAITDVDMPVPGPDDVVIRVHAVGVNRLDLLLREGSVFQVPLPRIPGTDFAGEIVEVGTNVNSSRVGQRVFAAPILSCGQCEHCLRGDDNLCSKFGTVGSTIDGGYAQFARVPARNAIELPAQMDYIRGASFALTYATAAAMLRRGRLAEGEWVMILGANGGLGYAAVELASAMGADVIAIGRTADTDEALRGAGAASVVLAGPRMADQVIELTGGRGVDLVFEHVGAATFEQSVSAIESFIEQHREFLDRHYRAGHFVLSGPQVPRVGGVILVRNLDRQQLDAVVAEDPFYRERLARYEIIEFSPNKFADGARQLLAPTN